MTYYPEPGKDAITRDGRKVTQITVADDPSALYPVHGVLDGRALTWTEKGWFMSDESGDPRDLAGPWHDRIEKLEAKLAKAVEALEEIATDEHPIGWVAIAALAELKGTSDE